MQTGPFQFVVGTKPNISLCMNRSIFDDGRRLNPAGVSSAVRIPANSNARVVVRACCLAFFYCCKLTKNSTIFVNIVRQSPAF